MSKISFDFLRSVILVALSCFIFGCSKSPETTVSGIWRSEGALKAKNLVIEFVPGGTGNVFSGSIIGFPTDAAFRWEQDGDQIEIETETEEPVVQTMTIISQSEKSLVVKVNRTEFRLVRVDDVMDSESFDSLP